MDRRKMLQTMALATGGATVAALGAVPFPAPYRSLLIADIRQERTMPEMLTIREPARDLPVRAKVDVLVCGGGLGGVSAAVAAARAGARTMLVERNGFPGGVATAGMCCSVFNYLYTPKHEPLVKGNSLEFIDRLAAAEGYGTKWREHKGHIIFDVERGKLVLTELLEEAGVQYLWDTTVCGAFMDTEGTTIQGVAIESKSGREALLAEVVVDATGDADVAALAGAPVHTLRDIPGAKHSFVFRIGNVDLDAFVQYFLDHPDQYPEHMDVDWSLDEAVAQYRQVGTFLFPHGGGMQMDIIKQGVERGEYPTKIGVHDTIDALQMHAIRDLGVVHVITGFLKLSDLNIAEITRGMADGRRMAFQVTDFFRRHMPGFSRAAVVNTADDLGIRASRWLDGDFVFTKEMRGTPVRFPDAIGRGVVEEFRVKHPGPRAWATEVLTDASFDIPYRCLLPRKVDGLVMGAGRSISAQDPHLLRIMAVTMIVGQGAGVAAAMSARAGCTPREVQIGAVQEELRRQGVALG